MVSALTAVGSVFLYAKFAPRSIAYEGKSEMPVNYAGLFDRNINNGQPVDFQQAAMSAIPAVVHIKTKTNPTQASRRRSPFSDFFGEDIFDQFFGSPNMNRPQMASGSGVIMSSDGYIITNNHVIDGADEMTVTLSNKKQYKAKLIASDANTDLALVKIEASGLPYVVYGNSDEVNVGQWVLAVGYPLNLEATVTAGIISAKARFLGINERKARDRAQVIESFLQTDAAVNQGNSGGALVNTAGQLIGINSAIASPTGAYAGYSYAIPVNIVKKVMEDLMKFGSVQRAYLGIRPYINNSDETDSGIKEGDGVTVGEVMANSAAEAAKLKKGDKIIKLNNKVVNTWNELTGTIASFRPGEKINVTFMRDGKESTVSVTLKNSAGNTDVVKTSVLDKLGASFETLDKKKAGEYGLEGGVEIKTIGDGLLNEQTTIKKGFIIIRAGGKTVRNVEELTKVIEEAGNSIMVEGIYPGYDGVYAYGINDLRR